MSLAFTPAAIQFRFRKGFFSIETFCQLPEDHIRKRNNMKMFQDQPSRIGPIICNDLLIPIADARPNFIIRNILVVLFFARPHSGSTWSVSFTLP